MCMLRLRQPCPTWCQKPLLDQDARMGSWHANRIRCQDSEVSVGSCMRVWRLFQTGRACAPVCVDLQRQARRLCKQAILLAVHRYDCVHFGREHSVNTMCSFVFTPKTAQTLCWCSSCVHFGPRTQCQHNVSTHPPSVFNN